MDITATSRPPKPRGPNGQYLSCGNERGRPKGTTRPELIRRRLARAVHRDADQIITTMIAAATAGDACAAGELLRLALTPVIGEQQGEAVEPDFTAPNP